MPINKTSLLAQQETKDYKRVEKNNNSKIATNNKADAKKIIARKAQRNKEGGH